MADQEYGPTPPNLLIMPDGSRLPTSPDSGTIKTFDSERLGLAVFRDAIAHLMASTIFYPDRCVEVEAFAEAYDAAGGRLASGHATIQVARLGNAAPTFVGTPLMLAYTPVASPPWVFPTVSADLVAVGVDRIAIAVLGLPGVPIRWRASIKVIGAQAQQVS